jgi:adenylate cyclase
MDHWENFNPVENAKARELAEQATNLDPNYALAWALQGMTYWFGARTHFDEDAQISIAGAVELGAKALALDETNPLALGVNMLVQLSLGNFDKSLAIGDRLISLHPGNAESRAWYAHAPLSIGRPQESLSMMKDAMRLNPRYPLWYKNILARALDVAGQKEKALEALDEILLKQPDFFPAVMLRTGFLAREGRIEEAKEVMTDMRRINPIFRLAHLKDFFMSLDHKYVADFTEALRKAGLPE